MKRSAVSRLVVCALLVAVTIAPAFGGGRKKSASPAPQHHEPVISSVGPNTVTVSDNKTTKTLTVTRFTEINVNGRKATMADLKPRMTVTVILGTDPTVASRISAAGKK
jgi:hypothetical protein